MLSKAVAPNSELIEARVLTEEEIAKEYGDQNVHHVNSKLNFLLRMRGGARR